MTKETLSLFELRGTFRGMPSPSGKMQPLRKSTMSKASQSTKSRTSCNGLQPSSDGLQPSSDGLQPKSDGLHSQRFFVLELNNSRGRRGLGWRDTSVEHSSAQHVEGNANLLLEAMHLFLVASCYY